MIKISELEEAEGLTRTMIEDYLSTHDWAVHPRNQNSWIHRKTLATLTTRDDATWHAVMYLAEVEQRSIQSLLRDMNQRWYIGTPDHDQIRAHGGSWLIQYGREYRQIVSGNQLYMHANAYAGPFKCWPVDTHGNRVPMPRTRS